MFDFAVIVCQYQDHRNQLWYKWANNHLGWGHGDVRFKVTTFLYEYPCLILQSLCVSIKIIRNEFGIIDSIKVKIETGGPGNRYIIDRNFLRLFLNR